MIPQAHPMPQARPDAQPNRSEGRADRNFRRLAVGAGLGILAVTGGVLLFLIVQGIPGLLAPGAQIPGADNIWGYLGPLAFGTVLVSVLALAIAAPLSVGVGLFASHYAPRRVAGFTGYLIDLLAAVPSVVYGLWGIYFLAPTLVPVFEWLEGTLGFLPFFAGPVSVTGRTALTAAIVLAIMVLPISTSLCREVFLQVPRLHEEAALALGATRWEMVRTAVLPYAKAGVASAWLLGLGRALGETMAVTMVLSATGAVTWNLIGNSNPTTVAANIALDFPEASGIEVNILIASGLMLFVITLAVNMLARRIVRRPAASGGAR